jgi:hypothetical protein
LLSSARISSMIPRRLPWCSVILSVLLWIFSANPLTV